MSRIIGLQMMASLNWRVDNPMDWINNISDDEYADLVQFYETCDAILVGSTTFLEMRSYWPSQCEAADPATPHGRMAKLMTEHKKLVVTQNEHFDVGDWSNSERLFVRSNDDLVRHVERLKSAPGKNIHLAGGSSLARSMLGLGLVDRLRLHMHPALSQGPSIFAELAHDVKLTKNSVATFANGATLLDYSIISALTPSNVADFDELRSASKVQVS